jgi:hypothetical protein
MRAIGHVIFFALLGSAVSLSFADSPDKKPLTCLGTSDASAAAAISEDMFIVADDENNTLRVYKIDIGGLPICSYDLTDFLDVKSQYPEADIEGATMTEDRIYWITSHGRNKDGRLRLNRYRFFATTIKVQNGNVTITPIGRPCKTLVHKMLKAQTLRHLGLDKATRFNKILTNKEREKLAPKEKGLNIEALCASADGTTLYIGFRNPLPVNSDTHKPNALVVPLNNAAGVIERQDEPILGEPILWDLAGLGIRSMEYSPFHKAYFIIAGPRDEESKFALYSWSGNTKNQPVLVCPLSFEESDFTPEALIPFKNSAGLLLLSDDGSLAVKVTGPHECLEGEFREDGTCPNKFLLDSNKKTFRAIRLTP